MTELILSFRLATDEDVEKIHSWLLGQGCRNVHGSFLCNWNLTLEVHKDSQLIVAIFEGEPIAYIWEDFGILEVREGYRRQSVGKQLVEYAIYHANYNGRPAVLVECKPETSIPFWKKMGFVFHSENEATYIFEKFFDISIEGLPVEVDIQFYPENAKWNDQVAPIKSFYLPAVLDTQGIIRLQYRVAAYIDSWAYNGDALIKICIGGEVIYFDKVRYSAAKSIGGIYNSGVFYIDQVYNYEAQ